MDMHVNRTEGAGRATHPIDSEGLAFWDWKKEENEKERIGRRPF